MTIGGAMSESHTDEIIVYQSHAQTPFRKIWAWD